MIFLYQTHKNRLKKLIDRAKEIPSPLKDESTFLREVDYCRRRADEITDTLLFFWLENKHEKLRVLLWNLDKTPLTNPKTIENILENIHGF